MIVYWYELSILFMDLIYFLYTVYTALQNIIMVKSHDYYIDIVLIMAMSHFLYV